MGELYTQAEGIKPWQSKTLWVNLVMAGLSFFPAFRDFVTPEHIATMFTVANVVLRLVTKDKIVLK
jgi:hypothetical protein